MRVTLANLLPVACREGYAVPCFNVFGYEDAVSVVRAAEALESPVILATNKEMVEFMGTATLAAMLGQLADDAVVPVCVHLDHCYEVAIAKRAVDDGYTSVMFDGSQLSLQENIDLTREVSDHAHDHGVSVEGEIGSVPYSEGRDYIRSILTEPDDASEFSKHSGADAVAVSVGNVHRQQSVGGNIDYERLAAIRKQVSQPLVIHGSSGIADADQSKLAQLGVAKFNIGTTLRMSFGRALRGFLAENPHEFDRLTIFNAIMPVVQQTAESHIRVLGSELQAPAVAQALNAQIQHGRAQPLSDAPSIINLDHTEQ